MSRTISRGRLCAALVLPVMMCRHRLRASSSAISVRIVSHFAARLTDPNRVAHAVSREQAVCDRALIGIERFESSLRWNRNLNFTGM
jgi:hypothetical protein